MSIVVKTIKGLSAMCDGGDCWFCAELAVADRRHKVEIKQLEQEIPRWQVLVESVTGELLSLWRFRNFLTLASNRRKFSR